MEGNVAAGADTLGLVEYLAAAWRAKYRIGAGALVAAAIGAAVSLIGPNYYESTVTFAATQSKLGDGGQLVANTAQFRPMVESLKTAAAVIRETGLDKSPYLMRPSDFLDAIAVSEIRGTNLITVKIALPDAALASTVANTVAAHAIQTAREVSAGEAGYARDLVKEQLDQARDRLDQVQKELREFRQRARVEAVRQEAYVKLGLALPSVFMDDPSRVRGILDAGMKLAGEKAKLAVTERELAARGSGRSDALTQSLESSAAQSRAAVASLDQQRAELLRTHTLDASTVALLNRMYEVESELARRETERAVAEKIYSEVAQKYQEARLQVIGRSAEFVIIDPAVPSDRPVRRHVGRNTVIAALIWLVFATGVVLLWDSTKRLRGRL